MHLKIDTGMERLGQHYYTAEHLLNAALNTKHCDIVGVFSHLACAEDSDRTFTRLQVERFEQCLSFFEKHSLAMPVRHLANSGGILRYPETHFDLVRPGLILYGVTPIDQNATAINLKATLRLRSEVVYFKVV